jgi:Domain of unknown function (DUF222)
MGIRAPLSRLPTDEERFEAQRSLANLRDEITTLAGHLNAANHRFLMLIAEFDRREGWTDGSTHSCAHWLNWKCGIALGAAREKVRVAHALQDLPRISAAMECGQLSYSKVRELTRVAEVAMRKPCCRSRFMAPQRTSRDWCAPIVGRRRRWNSPGKPLSRRIVS